MIRFFTVLIFCFGFFISEAQVFVQLEKSYSSRKWRFYPNSSITYKLKGKDNAWKTETIQRVVPTNSLFITENGMIRLEDIDVIRFHRTFPKFFEKKMYIFAGGWAFFNVIGELIKEDKFTKNDVIIVGTSAGSGFLINQIFKHKNCKIGKKYRLRTLDLNFQEKKY